MSANLILRIILAYLSILFDLLPKKLRLHLLPSWAPRHSPIHPPLAASAKSSTAMDAADLSRVFQMLDQNGDGRITLDELTTSLQNMGIFIADKELDQMIQKIDVNGDGCVDFDEFCMLYKTIMDDAAADANSDAEKDMLEAFNVFDQNGDGFITVDELRAVLGMLGLGHGAEEECRMMIKRVDVDGDGMVSFNEFKQMMRSGGGLTALSN